MAEGEDETPSRIERRGREAKEARKSVWREVVRSEASGLCVVRFGSWEFVDLMCLQSIIGPRQSLTCRTIAPGRLQAHTHCSLSIPRHIHIHTEVS